MGYQDQKNIELLDQFKQLNANLENICEQLCILSWQHEQQLKEKGILPIFKNQDAEKKNDDYGALEMD